MENLFVFSLKVKKCMEKLKSFLGMKVHGEALYDAPSPNTENVKTGVELPKLVFKKFGVGPFQWNQFREAYEAAIHQNTSISKVRKFSYLINYFDGSAKQAIDDFPVTNKAYKEAYTSLKIAMVILN